jgi:hypothetical protein
VVTGAPAGGRAAAVADAVAVLRLMSDVASDVVLEFALASGLLGTNARHGDRIVAEATARTSGW